MDSSSRNAVSLIMGIISVIMGAAGIAVVPIPIIGIITACVAIAKGDVFDRKFAAICLIVNIVALIIMIVLIASGDMVGIRVGRYGFLHN